MPTRCNRCFLLQILLLAQHVSGTITPIIRSSRVLYSWLLPVVYGAWFSSCQLECGDEGCVSGLRAAVVPDCCFILIKFYFGVLILVHLFCLFCITYFDVFLTVNHSIDLFDLPTLMHNSFIH